MARERWYHKVISLLTPPKPIKIEIRDAEKGSDIQDRVQRLRATLDGEEQWFLCLTKDKDACVEDKR